MTVRIVRYRTGVHDRWKDVPAEFQLSTLSKKQRNIVQVGAQFQWFCKGCGNPGQHAANCSSKKVDSDDAVPITNFFKPVVIAPSPPPESAYAAAPALYAPTASTATAASTDSSPPSSFSTTSPIPAPVRVLSAAQQAEVDEIVQSLFSAETSIGSAVPLVSSGQTAPAYSSSVAPILMSSTIPLIIPPPFAEHDAPAWSEQTMAYANAFWAIVEKNLPKMYAQKPVSASGNWRAKKTVNMFTPEVPFPNPLQLQYHSELHTYARTAAVFELGRAVYVIDDPMMFYTEHMPEKGLVCPFPGCKECHLEREGYCPGVRVETQAFNSSTTRLHKVAQFRCPKCKAANRLAYYTLYSEEVFSQLPPLVRAQYPYVVTSKSFVSFDTVNTIEALKLKGVSFLAMEEASANIFETQRAWQEIQYMLQIESIKSAGSVDPPHFTRSILASPPIAPVLSAELAADKLIAEADRQGPFIQASVAALGPLTTHLQIDHNFQHKGGNKKGGRAWLHGLNQNSEVAIAVVTEGESLNDAQTHFERIKNDGLLCVETDHVRKDKLLLKKLLGPNIRVYGDIFHWMKCLLESVKAGDLFASFALELSYCFLVPVAADVIEVERRLIDGGMPAEEARTRCLDKYFIRKRHDVRRRKLPKKDCLVRLETLHKRFAGMENMFLSTFHTKWASLMKKTEEDYEVDEADELFVNIGTGEQPHWIAVRGTNGTESFHNVLDKMKIGNYGVNLQNACYVLGIGAWNHSKQKVMCKKKVLEHVTDITMLNELAKRSLALRNLNVFDVAFDTLPYADFRPIPPSDSLFVGVFAGANETNVREAFDLFSDKDGDVSAFPRFKGSDEELTLLGDVEPRDLISSGRHLITAMMESALFYVLSVKKKIAKASMDQAQVWLLLHENSIMNSIDLHAMTLSFNGYAFEAMNDCLGAEQAKLPVPRMIKYGITFPANDLFPTAPAHVKEHLENVIKSKVIRAKLPSKYVDTTMPVVSAPPAKACVDGGALPLPKHVVSDPRSLVAPKNLARVCPETINDQHGHGSIKRRRVNPASTLAASTSMTVAAPTPTTRSLFECPHCPTVFRASKRHEESCPFRLWKKEPGVSRPPRAFDESLGRKRNANEAWRISYMSMANSTRRAICRKHGCMRTHEEWN